MRRNKNEYILKLTPMMHKQKIQPYSKTLKEMMSQKSKILSQAQTLSDIGIPETAQVLWQSAAQHEEHIAPMLDVLGRELDATIHRISAASCYEKAGDLGRAVNLYRAALSGPLRDDTRVDVEKMLRGCLVAMNS